MCAINTANDPLCEVTVQVERVLGDIEWKN
jgi:hypothetical protein